MPPPRLHRPDPEPFDGLGPDGIDDADDIAPADRRWDAYRVGLLGFAAGATLGLLCLVPAWPEGDTPVPAPIVRRSTGWSAYDPASGIDPALVARPVPVPVNEAPGDATPEPPLTPGAKPAGGVSSRVGTPGEGGAR